MNPSQATSSSPPNNATQSQSLVERFSTKHISKIPIPVLAKNKSRKSQLNGNQQRSFKAQIRDSVSHYNGATLNNSKVDQIIADLLIEALNHSTDIGIEFIKTPQNPTSQSHLKLNPSKRTSSSTRRTNGVAMNAGGSSAGGKRSAHSSAKYQQVFDSIPEEKSGSLSMESLNDEHTAPPPVDQSSTNSTANPMSETESTAKSISPPNKSNNTSRKSSPKSMPNGIQTKVASGKAAIENDQVTSETWFGCFGRTHVDSPVDGSLMEEGILKIMHITSLAV